MMKGALPARHPWNRFHRWFAQPVVRSRSTSPVKLDHLVTLIACQIVTDSPIAAAPNTCVMRINHARFVYLVSQQPAFALMIMDALSKRLRASNAVTFKTTANPTLANPTLANP